MKRLRLVTAWEPTRMYRPNARQSTTLMFSGGWSSSFSGRSFGTPDVVALNASKSGIKRAFQETWALGLLPHSPLRTIWPGCWSLGFSCSSGWEPTARLCLRTQCPHVADPLEPDLFSSGLLIPRTKPAWRKNKVKGKQIFQMTNKQGWEKTAGQIPPLCGSGSEQAGSPVAPGEWVHALSLLAPLEEEDQPDLLDQSEQEDKTHQKPN